MQAHKLTFWKLRFIPVDSLLNITNPLHNCQQISDSRSKSRCNSLLLPCKKAEVAYNSIFKAFFRPFLTIAEDWSLDVSESNNKFALKYKLDANSENCLEISGMYFGNSNILLFNVSWNSNLVLDVITVWTPIFESHFFSKTVCRNWKTANITSFFRTLLLWSLFHPSLIMSFKFSFTSSQFLILCSCNWLIKDWQIKNISFSFCKRWLLLMSFTTAIVR